MDDGAGKNWISTKTNLILSKKNKKKNKENRKTMLVCDDGRHLPRDLALDTNMPGESIKIYLDLGFISNIFLRDMELK